MEARGPDAATDLEDGGQPGSRRLSLERIARAAREIDPVFLATPQYRCAPLSDQLGCAVTLKVETLNPIRSFKGRGASFFVAGLSKDTLRTGIVCASAGNFGQALAYVCRPYGIRLVVYAAYEANALKIESMRTLGAEVRLSGEDFDAAKSAAVDWASTSGARLVVDGLDPAISEGAGTIGRELLARGDRFDTVVIPVGNGALINGVARWLKAASPKTRVIGVCSAQAPAMAEAFRNGAHQASDTARPRTIADGIAVRVPIPEAVADMVGLVDDVLLVGDSDLVEAMRLLHRHAGVVVEPAGAAGVAALLSSRAAFAGSDVATVIGGSNLTLDQVRCWLGDRT